MTERLRHFQELVEAHDEVSDAMIRLYREADSIEKMEMEKTIYRLTWRSFIVACG